MKIERRHALWAGAVVVLAAIVVWIMLPDRVSVETAVIERGPLAVTVEEDGQTRVQERYVVSAPITGRMVRLECEVGQAVSAGDVLAEIHPLPLDTRTRTEAASRLETAEATRRAALARVDHAATLAGEAERARDRLERVVAADAGAIAQQRLDQARTAARAAALDLEQARAAAQASAHDVATARAALLGADGGAGGRPTQVRAPAAGRVLRVFEECERVLAAGSPILEIGDPARLEIVADVLSQDAARFREGSPALVTAGGDADTVRAVVRRIDPAAFTKVSPLGVEEQRVNVILGFDGDPPFLGDRYRVAASIITWQSDDVLRVPVSALFRSGSEWAVYVVGDGVARLRIIDIGQRGGRHAEVLHGLEAGDRVVLYPGQDVHDGTRVSGTGAGA